MFKKDFNLFRKSTAGSFARQNKNAPEVPIEPPPPPRPERQNTYHATLLLLDINNIPQAPPGYWDNKNVHETPPTRTSSSLAVFSPETPNRQAEARQRRLDKERAQERARRSQKEGWSEGPAQQVTELLEGIEDVRNDLRDAAQWHNALMVAREQRRALSSGWFADKESDSEKRLREEVESRAKGVAPLNWAREHEPLLSSAASVKSSSRSISENARSSVLSTTSSYTARSSIFSTTQSSTISSPPTSGLPSPALSTHSKEGNTWKGHSARPSLSDRIPPLNITDTGGVELTGRVVRAT